MRERVAATAIMFSALCVWNNAVCAQSFDGITIVELSDAAADVIKGHSLGSSPYLVIYASDKGTYAAVGDGRDERNRSCVAWADAAEPTGETLVFGLPPSEQSLKLVFPSVCLPFSVSFSGADKVKIEATNMFETISGPLDARAREIRYSGDHDILARVPNVALDWSVAAFSRYDIKGIRLGPLPALKAVLGADVEFDLGPLRAFASGPRKRLRITTPNPADRTDSTTVNGEVVGADMLGWPADVLYRAEYTERLTQKALTEVFEEAIVDRYGDPGRSAPGRGGGLRNLYWFFDLNGRRLSVGESAVTNCLATRDYWIDGVDLTAAKGDIGPWGCSLIVLLIHDGEGGVVRRYSIEAASGYIMALNHFAMRLEEMREKRTKIQEVQEFRPKL
jgi:hypothetical protein